MSCMITEMNSRLLCFRPSTFRHLKRCTKHPNILHSVNQIRQLSKCSTSVSVLQGYTPHQHRGSQHKFCKKSHQRLLTLAGVLPVRYNSVDAAATSIPPPPTAQTSTSVQATTEATQTVASGYVDTPFIPEPPSVPEPTVLTDALNAIGEPTFASIGLCNRTPTGFVQYLMENVHIMADMPWYATIIAATFLMRVLVFPVFIKGRIGSTNYANHMPTITKLQERYRRAQAQGDPLEADRLGVELRSYIDRNDIKIWSVLLMPMVQAPIFLSMLTAVRGMVNAPVESMKTGGLYWFSDLTVCDPYYILPILTSITAWITLEVGADTASTKAMKPMVRYAVRLVPFCMLIFTVNFPTAMLLYWFTNNAFSLLQVGILKWPAFKNYFGIPDPIVHNRQAAASKPKAPKGLLKKITFYRKLLKKNIDGYKDSRRATKKIAEIENRHKADARAWKKAGTVPIVKTYSYDPTKVTKRTKSS